MKRPLFFLFIVVSCSLFLWYPRSYTPDPVFPQGGWYDVTAAGTVVTCSCQNDRLSLTLRDCRLAFQGQDYRCERLLVSLSGDNTTADIRAGNRLSVTGSLTSFQPARNPGNFDWHAYYSARHISYRIYADEITVTDPHCSFLREGLRQLHRLLERQLSRILPADPETVSLLKALVLGDKTALEEETRNQYETGGILHILSVSGLHVSLLGGAVLTLCRFFRLPPHLGRLAVSAFILLYWQLCGASLSAGRAAVMFLCLAAAPVLNRSYDSLSALSLAGLLFLWDSPSLLFQAGFQLSYGAVLGIQLVCPTFALSDPAAAPRAAASGRSQYQAWAGRILAAFSFGLGLQLTLLPITLYHFYRYPLYGILLNLVVLPLTAPLFLCAVSGLLLSFLWLPFGRLFFLPCRLILALYDLLCTLTASLPGASSVLGRPAAGRIFLYYAFLAAFCLLRKHRTALPGLKFMPGRLSVRFPVRLPGWLSGRFPLPLSLLLLPVLLFPLPRTGLSVTFLDVGQGDCAFLLTPSGTSILIDGGSSDLDTVTENRLLPFLESQRTDSLDYIFLSHSDADHVNAVVRLLNDGYSIGTIFLPRLPERLAREDSYQKLLAAAAAAQVPLLCFSQGQSWSEGELSVRCLSPLDSEDPRTAQYTSLNAASLVLLAEYQGIRLLFTGDCCEEGEELLLQTLTEQNLTCHILKAGHHGSAGATSSELLQQLAPRAVIVSCGIRNRYGHPHPDMLARTEQLQIPCYVTAGCGAVTVVIQKGKARLFTMLPPGELFYR